MIAFVDLAAFQVCLALGLATRSMLSRWLTAEIESEQYFALALGLFMLPLIHYQIGLYPGYLIGPVERLRRRILSTVAVFGGLVAWDNIVARGVLSRGILLATFLFALTIPPAVDTAVRLHLVRSRRWGIPVLIIGAGSTGRTVARTLSSNPLVGLVPIAFLDNRSELWGRMLENVPVVGPLGLAEDFENRAGGAIIALNDVNQSDLPELNFPRVIVIPDLAGMATLWVTARDMGGCLGLELKKNLLIRRNVALKKTMDRAIGLALFIASVPLVAIAAIWLKIASRGPVFYRQLREGFDGRRISVPKLRTMHVDGDRILSEWLNTHPDDRDEWIRKCKLRHDPRVLPVIGTLLRRTSLDELPQLWSVIKGEMSLVGPRPFPDYHLDRFSPEFRKLRTRVLPGLTGLWQVSARSDGDLSTQESLDTYYIRNWSPWLDLYILARTVTAVLFARGAY